MAIDFQICSTNAEYYPFNYHITIDGDDEYIKDGELDAFIAEHNPDGTKPMSIAYLIYKEGSTNPGYKHLSFPYAG